MEEITRPPQTAQSLQERRCPSCGAAMPQGARFCGACGMESSPTGPGVAASVAETSQVGGSAPTEPVAPSPAPVGAIGAVPAASASAQPSAPGTAHGADERVCPWCDAVNPLDAARCMACGAVFPTPEGDEALERAAIARIQSMESEISQQRRGWWPFRSR